MPSALPALCSTPLFKGTTSTNGIQGLPPLPSCFLELLTYTHAKLGTYFFLTQHTVSPIAARTPAAASTPSITATSESRQVTRTLSIFLKPPQQFLSASVACKEGVSKLCMPWGNIRQFQEVGSQARTSSSC